MSEHTILPWAISPVRTTEDTAMIVAGDGPDFGLVADVTEDIDAAFILQAVNNHDALVKALRLARKRIEYLGAACNDPRHFEANDSTYLPAIDEVLAVVGKAEQSPTVHRETET